MKILRSLEELSIDNMKVWRDCFTDGLTLGQAQVRVDENIAAYRRYEKLSSVEKAAFDHWIDNPQTPQRQA